MKGGYQILNLKNVPFTTDGAAMMIEGIYEVIEGNNFKPLLIENFVLDGIEKIGAYVVPKLNGTNFELDVYGKKIVITDVDSVRVESIEKPFDIGNLESVVSPIDENMAIITFVQLHSVATGGSKYKFFTGYFNIDYKTSEYETGDGPITIVKSVDYSFYPSFIIKEQNIVDWSLNTEDEPSEGGHFTLRVLDGYPQTYHFELDGSGEFRVSVEND